MSEENQTPLDSNQAQVPPKNWLVESILITLFCCMPLGVVGIINATQVNSKFAIGDYDGAQKASETAGKFVKFGFIGGLVVGVIYVVAIAIGALNS